MERLYTPWRMKYITSTHKKEAGCIFCNKLAEGVEHDRENFILYRGRLTFVIMNIYPYNTGHLMIVPHLHVATLPEVPRQAQFEMIGLASFFSDLLSELMAPDGFNIGLNIGRAAGAGIDSHVHLHLVPRWLGDSNFMPVVGETRVLPELLEETYDKIMELLQEKSPEDFLG